MLVCRGMLYKTMYGPLIGHALAFSKIVYKWYVISFRDNDKSTCVSALLKGKKRMKKKRNVVHKRQKFVDLKVIDRVVYMCVCASERGGTV